MNFKVNYLQLKDKSTGMYLLFLFAIYVPTINSPNYAKYIVM
jgi:hypothetical protein